MTPGGQPASWRQIYRHLAEKYGWTPEQVNKLTSYQMRMYLSSEDDIKPLAEPTVPREAFPLHWRKYLSQMAAQMESLKNMILRGMGVKSDG